MEKRDKFRCDSCGVDFDSKEKLDAHNRSVHQQGQQRSGTEQRHGSSQQQAGSGQQRSGTEQRYGSGQSGSEQGRPGTEQQGRSGSEQGTEQQRGSSGTGRRDNPPTKRT
jgi:hypothetical protein